jgi:excisionase family DNA binding protein
MKLFADSRIYKVRQLAGRIESTKDFVWREIRRGHLPAIRLASNLVRLKGSDLNAWLERGVTALAVEEEVCAKE